EVILRFHLTQRHLASFRRAAFLLWAVLALTACSDTSSAGLEREEARAGLPIEITRVLDIAGERFRGAEREGPRFPDGAREGEDPRFPDGAGEVDDIFAELRRTEKDAPEDELSRVRRAVDKLLGEDPATLQSGKTTLRVLEEYRALVGQGLDITKELASLENE